MHNKIIEKLKNKQIAIMGFGKEGKSSYNFIRRYLKNQTITLLDKLDILKNNEYLKNDKNLNIITGENYLENLDKYDLIIKSPGIALLDIDTKELENKLTSQLQLILEINRQNIIGITGTKGKSTTSSLIFSILKKAKINVKLIGNIGIPPFECLEEFDDNITLVYEMSSHQLENVKNSPHIAILLLVFIALNFLNSIIFSP